MEQKEEKNQQPIRTTRRKKESKKNEDSLSSLWDNFKRSNISIIGVPESEEKEQETGSLSEKIVKENFPNLEKEIDMQIQEVQRVPNKMDEKRRTPRHIIIKMPKVKDKERILAARKMADGKVGEERTEKPQRTGATGVMEGKVPVAALRSDQLKKKLQTSQQSLQRSPSLDLP